MEKIPKYWYIEITKENLYYINKYRKIKGFSPITSFFAFEWISEGGMGGKGRGLWGRPPITLEQLKSLTYKKEFNIIVW